MYTQEALDLLKNRIGFGDEGEITVSVDLTHRVGSTGRVFSGFHKLVTLDNLFDTVDLSQTEEPKFNALLNQMKVDAVAAAVVEVLDHNKEYLDDFDYSNILSTKANLFDEVIGYKVAIASLELIVTSMRINDSERMASAKYDKLKIELEGITDDKGRVIAKGIKSRESRAIRIATNIIFPQTLKVKDSTNVW